jgi:flagellar basal-body rod protein FlgF
VIYGYYQSAAGMMVQEYRQDVLANNLANADTHGFKREIASFAQRLSPRDAGMPGKGNDAYRSLPGNAALARTETDFSEAPFEVTGNELDVAIAGPGFLRVATARGEALTRDGRIVSDADGRLVAAIDGAAILGRGGQEIRTNPRGGAISIDTDGGVSQNGIRVGEIGVVEPADYAGLQKIGAGRFAAGTAQLADSKSSLLAGRVEQSGVESVRELTTMLESTRAYQLNAQMLTLQDQSAARLIAAVRA